MTVPATPRGTWWLPVGLVLVGISGYGFLGVVGRELGPAGAAPLAVLWTVTNIVGAGLFLPVEQELTRRLSAGPVSGAGAARVVGAAVRSTGLLIAVLCAAAALAGEQIDRLLFSGQTGLTWCCVATCIGFALQHVCRGVFAASGRFDRYGIQLIVDGLIRVGGAVALDALGTFPIIAFGAVLAIAPLLSLAVAFGVPAAGAGGTHPHDPTDATASTWGRDVGLVTVGQIGSTLVVGAGPVVATLLARPEEQAAAAVFVGVLVLARVPLLGLYAAQALQLPTLVRLASGGMVTEFRRRVTATRRVVLGGVAVTAVMAWTVGPFAVTAALGSGFRTDSVDVTIVLTATVLYIGAALTCQALLAIGCHALVAACWSAGLLTYGLLLVPDQPIGLRVGTAFVTAAAVTLVLATVCVRHRSRVLRRPLSSTRS